MSDWSAAHFAVVVPAGKASIEVGDLDGERWERHAYRGSSYPNVADEHQPREHDPEGWFPGRLAAATANSPQGVVGTEPPDRFHTLVNVTESDGELDIAVLAVEVVRFASTEVRAANNIVIVHLEVQEPTDDDLLRLSAALHGKIDGGFPEDVVNRAIAASLPDDVASACEVRDGLVRKTETTDTTNDGLVLVCAVALARREPSFAPLNASTEHGWSAVRQWNHVFAYGYSPVGQSPSRSELAAEFGSVDFPAGWHCAVSELGVGVIGVDPDPTGAMYREYWSIAQTRFVDIVVLAVRQTLEIEYYSERLVQLGDDWLVHAQAAQGGHELGQRSVRDLQANVEKFVGSFVGFRNRYWFTVIPRRNRATALLAGLHEVLFTRELFDSFIADLNHMKSILDVMSNRIQAEYRAKAQADADAQRENRDWTISVVSAAVGLPSVTYAAAAITNEPATDVVLWWTLGWGLAFVPVIFIMRWILARHGRTSRESGINEGGEES